MPRRMADPAQSIKRICRDIEAVAAADGQAHRCSPRWTENQHQPSRSISMMCSASSASATGDHASGPRYRPPQLIEEAVQFTLWAYIPQFGVTSPALEGGGVL